MTAIERAREAFHARDWNGAGALCVEALKSNPSEPWALLLIGYMNAQIGKTAWALPALERAARGAPKEAPFQCLLGSAFNALGMRDRAETAFIAARRLDRNSAEAAYGLADVAFQKEDWEAADTLLARAIALKPDYADALAARAEGARWRRDLAAAEQFSAAALAITPTHGGALVTLARVALARGREEEALATADKALTVPLNLVQRGRILSLKGEALEKLDRAGEAYDAFAQANAADQQMFGEHWARADSADSPQRLARMAQYLQTQADPARWPQPTPSPQPEPVFLIGFPRSGTTLLGQILASHPQVQTMEEADTLADATAALVIGRTLESWDQLRPRDLTDLRTVFWKRVHQKLGAPPSRPVLINKMPMNINALGVIYLLFPQAKIILMRRDPRDVVLSCFKQRFEVNAATVHLLALDSAVRYYDAVMKTAEAASARLPLNMHTLRYEDVVTDFDATIGGLLSFLDLPWDDAVRDHTVKARESRILTPSSSTVVLPLYATAKGRWRQYEEQLAPYLPALAPWVRAFGYAAE